jgi:hypothetical protein
MQMTIDIPDDLARELEPKRERLAEILRRGLGELGLLQVGNSALADEVLTFLARGPKPQEIVAFRPSTQSVERIRELLEKNRGGTLTTEEEAEMDYVQSLNHLFSMIKAHARQHLSLPS